jgi:hypothetical protein
MICLAVLPGPPAFAQDEEETDIGSTVEDLESSEEAAEETTAEEEYDDGNYPVCFITEERWDTSAAKVEAIFRDRGSLKRVRFLNLAYMIMGIKLFQENNLGLELDSVSVVEYSTFGTEQERMLGLGLVDLQVWFVLSEQAIPNMKAPYMAAFASQEEATEFAKNREAQVLSYTDLLTKIIKRMNADEGEDGKYDKAIGFETN